MLRSNHLTHAARVELDGRLDAHLEALVLAADAGWSACLEQLDVDFEPGAVFTAAAVALQAPAARLPLVLDNAGAGPQYADAVVSAIGHSDFRVAEPQLVGMLSSREGLERALAVRGFAAHREARGRMLDQGLMDPDVRVRASAAKAVGEMGSAETPGHCEALAALLDDAAPAVRFQAARTLARVSGPSSATDDVLLETIESSAVFDERAVVALVSTAPLEARRWISDRVRDARRPPLALVAIETLGEPELLELAFPWMTDDTLARAAGDTFRTVTGCDLRAAALTRPRPTRVGGEPDDDPNNDAVDLPRDYELPFPDADKVRAWWQQNRDRYTPGHRYLDGVDLGEVAGRPGREPSAALRARIVASPPRLQTIAADALAWTHPQCPRIETHAFARRGRRAPGFDAQPWSRELSTR